MSEVRIARLQRRGVVAIAGPDAPHFLNDLVTADITAAAPGHAVYAALLTPQGKVLFDFIVFGNGDRFLFDLPQSSVAEFVKRITFYRLRAKVTIEDLSGSHHVLAAWGDGEPRIDGVAAPDPRLPALGWRIVAPAAADIHATASEADYDAHRIPLGMPEGGLDYAYGDAFPHDADIDQLGGVDFTKGCYIGQEVVSRMEHRGTARRRIVIATGTGPLPPPTTPITAGDRPVGEMMSSADGIGLAEVRLDRAKEAMDAGIALTASGTTLVLTIPDWARFGWPTRSED